MEVLVCTPKGRTQCISSCHGESFISVASIKQHMLMMEGIPLCEQRLSSCGYQLDDNEVMSYDEWPTLPTVNVSLRLCGGKGGFGSMLKSLGARYSSNMATNKRSCRDLSGRRLGAVDDEKKLADWIKGQPDRDRIAEEKRISKLEHDAKGPFSKPFDHHTFTTQLKETEDAVDEAIEVARRNKGKKRSRDEDVTVELSKGKHAKGSSTGVQSPKRLAMWDDDDNFSDNSSSSGEEGPECIQKKVVTETETETETKPKTAIDEKKPKKKGKAQKP